MDIVYKPGARIDDAEQFQDLTENYRFRKPIDINLARNLRDDQEDGKTYFAVYKNFSI